MSTESDSPNTGALGTIVAVGALAVVGIAFAVTALVRSELEYEETTKGANANLRTYRDLVAEWNTTLNAPPTWVDKERQLVTVPIDRAKQLTLADLAKAQPPGTVAPTSEVPANVEGAQERSVDRIGPADGPGAVTPQEAVGQEGQAKAPIRQQELEPQTPKQPGAAGQKVPAPKEQVPLKPAPKMPGGGPATAPGAPPPAAPPAQKRLQPGQQEQGR